MGLILAFGQLSDPFKIAFDQCALFLMTPSMDLPFSLECSIDFVKVLHMDQSDG